MTFIIEDELHAEPQGGEYSTFEAALQELKRRAMIPWDAAPNLAPCSGWRTCGRNYQIIEYDTSSRPWAEQRRLEVLQIDASGVRWQLPENRD